MSGPTTLTDFAEVWLCDWEFSQPEGHLPTPICLVAQELHSGQAIRLWEDDLRGRRRPPYAVSDAALFVAYQAAAECGCHLALGWPLPRYILDLYVEFRALMNGRDAWCGHGLVGALITFGLAPLDAQEKTTMRALAQRGGPWAPAERHALLEYCAGDVEALTRLLPAMLPHISLPYALWRGCYVQAQARIEAQGIPINVPALTRLRAVWSDVQDLLVERLAPPGLYEGRTFKTSRFASWLAQHHLPWVYYPDGRPVLTQDVFEDMADLSPVLRRLQELRYMLSGLRLENLSVGPDQRNRVWLNPFGALTGRNAPSNSKSIFGPAVWLRGLIQPEPGRGLAYVDWNQQEFGIAAVLSGDTAMQDAYRSGDPYTAFARQAGAMPPEGTGATHGAIRELYKTCVLGVGYGMGRDALALRIGQSPAHAEALLATHRRLYPQYWRWVAGVVEYAALERHLWTVYGWPLYVETPDRPRTLQNFPAQSNAAEMLRLACVLALEAGVAVAMPVHDALLIEAPLASLDEAIVQTQQAMARASQQVLRGFPLTTAVKDVRAPAHYADPRGVSLWELVWSLVHEAEAAQAQLWSAPSRWQDRRAFAMPATRA